MKHRLWLVAPAVALYCGDVGLTLAGQPAPYWGGDYLSADEANPVASMLLVRSPLLFVGLAVVWLGALSAVVLWWRHPVSAWVAVLVAAAHAIGGACWLARAATWGLLAAGVYLALAAEVSSWCWCHAVQRAPAPLKTGERPCAG